MSPPQQEPPSRQNNDMAMAEQSRQSRISEHMARSAGVPERLRNDESWVEIASQPSSSSLSSIGDEIVTTGLRVNSNTHTHTRRRRRVQPGIPSRMGLEAGRQALAVRRNTKRARVKKTTMTMSSPAPTSISTTHHTPPTRTMKTTPRPWAAELQSPPSRRNQTHSPTLLHREPPVPASYFPPSSTAPRNPNPNPYASSSRRQQSYNATDHDAALRASLTTLLSIGAAAARGKRAAINPTTTSAEPMGLRLVPESQLTGAAQPNTSRPLSPSTRARSSPSVSSQEAIEKGKRKAAASGEKTKRRKKVAVAEAGDESTLFTWVVSAGVLVLVSVVGFGAGYVIGREVGRQEVSGLGFSDGGSCGREAMRGSGSLRRFKWGIGGGGKSVVA
ncbi:hypothetical protein LARI1_G002716 [Lachnellula arida]|uniref:Uncharacterized protein n=1 Tax=Lachnellula arida TaxID=1316785 RepID=A0A8T9BJA8_9HELO|nr:hypothetical protein LARI1_G002716 [Lachnellula arida]